MAHVFLHYLYMIQEEGGHAICCIGYDENGFILKNTWGGAWGDFGNCYLPYSQVNDNLLEAWGLIL